jgi:hypothetical protein
MMRMRREQRNCQEFHQNGGNPHHTARSEQMNSNRCHCPKREAMGDEVILFEEKKERELESVDFVKKRSLASWNLKDLLQ